MMQRTRDLCTLFQRDERGQAMVITAIMSLLLFRCVMASYNTGVAVASRIRGQNVADAAAFSGAIWQSRFLNYCAYTRRAILANYGEVALMKANMVIGRAQSNWGWPAMRTAPIIDTGRVAASSESMDTSSEPVKTS